MSLLFCWMRQLTPLIEHNFLCTVTAENGAVENLFLDLINLKRCDATTISTAVQQFFVNEGLDFEKALFSGMDGCSTMSGQLNGVKAHFEKLSGHTSYVHCRNHRLALCFVHLIPKFPLFTHYDSFLLNLYLLFDYSSVKNNILREVQAAYGSRPLTLIKPVPTRWLSHGNASKRVLDRYVEIIATLDAVYQKKQDAAVLGILQELLTSLPRFVF